MPHGKRGDGETPTRLGIFETGGRVPSCFVISDFPTASSRETTVRFWGRCYYNPPGTYTNKRCHENVDSKRAALCFVDTRVPEVPVGYWALELDVTLGRRILLGVLGFAMSFPSLPLPHTVLFDRPNSGVPLPIGGYHQSPKGISPRSPQYFSLFPLTMASSIPIHLFPRFFSAPISSVLIPPPIPSRHFVGVSACIMQC